ncbi:branched-chain amino acid transport system ATP-binding protein [Rhizobium aethiopicum]|uniref:Branched-chain amino acid transport system ATP-binding protein n=1 Tax=Rhizobium aethiopicum TaxID=1138170 RepID=A0A7W6QBG8_9HYPH|nr:ABC transporter ATP-binding protein [Rhizobium aethiopicum]MBB4194468.1 branched-chain amino acid transport system ATP-binding protein [Rhizobium aethiopicum]MBB4582137.1 branched-chain amino acid transport system ATP-binding protein [Rhizobium aethiopicum]
MSEILNVQNLRKSYGSITVVDDLSFKVEKGECLGVIGPNGAGKTSLFNVIDGGVVVDGGRITLDGEDVTRLPRHKRAHKGIARAYQVPQPFPDLTVFENVLVASTFAAGLSGHEAEVGALDVIRRVGLNERRRDRAGSLRLLDRKRLELAKALAASPKLLLLDEVAGGLTEAEVDVLVELVKSLKPHYAIIWIEHVAHALAATADRLMALHYGRKLIEGTPDQVLKSPEVRAIYLGIVDDATA